MGKKPSQPAPIKVTYPGPTPEELALQQQQADLAAQLAQQGQITFANSQADRGTALNILDLLRGPNKLGPEDEKLAQQLQDSYLNSYTKGITEGQNKETFDKTRADTIAGLAKAGTLNSTTASDLLGALEKEQMRQLQNASDEAASTGLDIRRQMISANTGKNMDLFNTLYTGQLGESNLASALYGNSANITADLGGQLSDQRDKAFQVQVQNKQADYLTQLQSFQAAQQRRKSLFGLGGAGVGAALGLALAPFTGGLSIAGLTIPAAAVGAGVGGAVGYGVGRTAGGLL